MSGKIVNLRRTRKRKHEKLRKKNADNRFKFGAQKNNGPKMTPLRRGAIGR